MFFSKHSKPVAAYLLAVFLMSQFLLVSSLLILPKTASAVPVVVTNPILPTSKVFDPYQVAKDIGIATAKTIALRYVNQQLTRFVNKAVEKYKIRNFLYYDQVLTNYYLNNYIRDKIADPDLRQIYFLLEASYITGQNTGLEGQPNPNHALIPRLKQKIYGLYLERGGIPEDYIFNPPRNANSYDYHIASSSYHLMQPSYVERNLRGQFGEFQSAATTAAQLEIIAGNGLKAGRLLGGECSFDVEGSGPASGIPDLTNNSGPNVDPQSSPASCSGAGGTWNPSALDEARAFIDNPTLFVEGHIDSALATIFDGNYNPNNIWSAIGSALGNFIYNRLSLDRSGGVLSEDPRGYSPVTDFFGSGEEVDIDGDGIMDGTDNDGDGELDVCYYGGVAPNCTGSTAATTNPGGGIPGGGTGVCAGIISPTPKYEGDVASANNAVLSANPELAGSANIDRGESRFQFVALVAQQLQVQGLNATDQVLNGNDNPNTGDLVAVWGSSDSTMERYDILTGGGDTIADAATVQYMGTIALTCVE